MEEGYVADKFLDVFEVGGACAVFIMYNVCCNDMDMNGYVNNVVYV